MMAVEEEGAEYCIIPHNGG
jgi:hypothetical protein